MDTLMSEVREMILGDVNDVGAGKISEAVSNGADATPSAAENGARDAEVGAVWLLVDVGGIHSTASLLRRFAASATQSLVR